MEKQQQIIQKQEEKSFNYSGFLGIKFWLTLLISLTCAVVTMLSSTSSQGAVSSTTFLLFFSILIVFATTYIFGLWGVVAALLSSVLFCITVQASFLSCLINVVANGAQALIIWFVLKKSEIDIDAAKCDQSFNDYKFLVLGIGLVYTVLSFIIIDYITLFIVITSVILVITIVYSIIEKNSAKIKFFLLLCVLPSFVGGFLNATNVFLTNGPFGDFLLDGTRWLFCNLILLSTFGFVLVSYLKKDKDNKPEWRKNKLIDSLKAEFTIKKENIKVGALTYYVGTFVWNILFYAMYIIGWLDTQTVFYLFPWAAGNIFMVANFLFSLKRETIEETEKDSFEWYEKRAIVAEKSANSIISVIGILFPLLASIAETVSTSQAVIFTLNLTCAVITLGLIWIPQNDVKSIETIKNIKTVFSLLTLSLLLLSALMFVVTFIQ